MRFALQHRQAIEVRPQSAREQRVARIHAVLRRDRRRDIRGRFADERDGFARRDVLEHDAQRGKIADDRCELPLDEHALAVEHVDRGIGDFAVDRQHDALRSIAASAACARASAVTPDSEFVVAPAG